MAPSMLLVYSPEGAWQALSEDERNAMYEQYFALGRELAAEGRLVSSHELQPTGTSTSVRVRDAETLVTDGAFAETKETLGDYYVIEAESREDAARWAARIASARQGTVEVRPVVMREAEVGA